jgi:hypothetical protein
MDKIFGSGDPTPVINGAKYKQSHKGSVIGILGGAAPEVTSGGDSFYNVGRWTARFLVERISKWAAKNPGVVPTRAVVLEWVRDVNAAPNPGSRIVIAETPDRLPLRTALALTGGGYHEALHSLLSAKRDLKLDEVADLILPRWAQVKDWSKIAPALLTWSNIVEDIRIERLGCKQFEDIRFKMCDLQDFILMQEAKADEKGGRVDPASIAVRTFRDYGLGYNTEKQRDAVVLYQKVNAEAVALVKSGPLSGLLREAINLSVLDDIGSLRVALDVLIKLSELGGQTGSDSKAKDSQAGDGAQKCPKCGAAANCLIVRPVMHNGKPSKSKGIVTCTKCGFQQEVDLQPPSASSQPSKGDGPKMEMPKDASKPEPKDSKKGEKPESKKDEKPESKGSKGSKEKGEDAEGGEDSDEESEDAEGEGSKDSEDEGAGGDDEGEDADEEGEGKGSKGSKEKGEDAEDEDEGDGEGSSSKGSKDSDEDSEEGEDSDGEGSGDEDSDEEGEDSGSAGGDSDGEGSEEGEGSEDGEPSDGEGSEGGAKDTSAEANAGGEGAGGHATEEAKDHDWSKLAEEILDNSNKEANKLDSNGALTDAVKDAQAKEDLTVEKNEARWNPQSVAEDKAVKVPNTRLKDADTIIASVKSEIAFLRSRLRTIVRSMEQTRTVHGVKKGRGISSRFLVDSKSAINAGTTPHRAYTTKGTQIDMSLAAAVVVDESGSMSSKLATATRIMTAIVEPLDALSFPTLAIGIRDAGYTAYNPYAAQAGDTHRQAPVVYDIFKSWDEKFRAVRGRFASTKAQGGTPLCDGVEYALRALSCRNEAHRFLFVVTDGEPNHKDKPVLRRQLRLAREAGITVIGVGIGEDSRGVMTLFPEHVWTTKFAEFPKLLLAKVNDFIDLNAGKRGVRVKKDR